jgi:hypothetical protein
MMEPIRPTDDLANAAAAWTNYAVMCLEQLALAGFGRRNHPVRRRAASYGERRNSGNRIGRHWPDERLKDGQESGQE